MDRRQEDNRSPSSTVNVEDLIDSGPWSLYQKFVVALAAVAFIAEGLGVPITGIAIPRLIHEWHQPREVFAPVTAIGLVGFAIGATLGGYLADRIGRRAAMIGAVFVFGGMTAATAFAGDITSFCVLRLLVGLGLGTVIPCGTTMIAEFTPKRQRSMALALGMSFLGVGGLLGSLLAALILPHFGWRMVFGAVGVIGLIYAFLLLFVLPESPRFISSMRESQAKLGRLFQRFGRAFNSDVCFIDPGAMRQQHTLAVLFDPRHRRDTLWLWAASFFLVLAFYSVFSWMPTALTSQGLSIARAGEAISVFSIGGILGNFITGGILGRWGTRVTFASLCLLTASSALMLVQTAHVSGANYIAYIGPIFLLGGGLSGVQTAIYALAAYVYPPVARTTGTGAIIAVGRVGAIASSYSGVAAMNLGASSAYYLTIALAAVFTMGFALAVGSQIQGLAAQRRLETS